MVSAPNVRSAIPIDTVSARRLAGEEELPILRRLELWREQRPHIVLFDGAVLKRRRQGRPVREFQVCRLPDAAIIGDKSPDVNRGLPARPGREICYVTVQVSAQDGLGCARQSERRAKGQLSGGIEREGVLVESMYVICYNQHANAA